MAHLESWRIIERTRRLTNGFNYVRMTMTRIAAPEPRHPIHNLAIVYGGVVKTLSAFHEPRLVLESPVTRKRHPVRGEI